MNIIDRTLDQSGITRAAIIFALAGGAAFLLYLLISGALALLFGIPFTVVLSGAAGCGFGAGLVNALISFWWA